MVVVYGAFGDLAGAPGPPTPAAALSAPPPPRSACSPAPRPTALLRLPRLALRPRSRRGMAPARGPGTAWATPSGLRCCRRRRAGAFRLQRSGALPPLAPRHSGSGCGLCAPRVGQMRARVCLWGVWVASKRDARRRGAPSRRFNSQCNRGLALWPPSPPYSHFGAQGCGGSLLRAPPQVRFASHPSKYISSRAKRTPPLSPPLFPAGPPPSGLRCPSGSRLTGISGSAGTGSRTGQ